MKGTNRKEMRKLLNKYVALMKVAFDNGLNMNIGSRLKIDGNGRPWITGYVYEEGTDFTDASQDGIKFLYFSAYEWRELSENRAVLKLVEDFIANHKK